MMCSVAGHIQTDQWESRSKPNAHLVCMCVWCVHVRVCSVCICVVCVGRCVCGACMCVWCVHTPYLIIDVLVQVLLYFVDVEL